jgi:hypothetical protein
LNRKSLLEQLKERHVIRATLSTYELKRPLAALRARQAEIGHLHNKVTAIDGRPAELSAVIYWLGDMA